MRGTLSIAMLVWCAVVSPVAATDAPVDLMPHRAVYDLKLASIAESGGTNISGITGRMVFEITGAACEGYTVNSRFVVEQTDTEGRTTLTDLRASSFESGDNRSLDFLSQSYTNQVLVNDIKGSASSGEDTLNVELVSPKSGTTDIDRHVIFPTEHVLKLIETAEAGGTILTADVFDGSETGTKVYETTAVIGAPETGAPPAIATEIGATKRWPVTISYFDAEGTGDRMPDYAVSFRLWENGVSTDIVMDYGDFALSGTLTDFERLDPANCE